MSYVLGISAFYHDSSVALFEGSRCIDFVKEEWITRIKGDQSFPHQALMHLINTWGLDSSNIRSVVFYEKPLKSWLEIFRYCSLKPWLRYRLAMRKLSSFWSGAIFFSAEIDRYFPRLKGEVLYCEHHKAHAANVLALSGGMSYTSGKIFVLDGYGEGASGAIYDLRLRELARFRYPASLGLFYSAITDYLGFEPNEGEFKVMGLASFGQPRYLDVMRSMIWFDNGAFYIDESFFAYPNDPTAYFSAQAFVSLPQINEPISAGESIAADIAASAQAHLEALVISLVSHYLSSSDEVVMLSGGVAQNVAMVSKLCEAFPNISIHVPPSPGDSGSAFGAACILLGHDRIEIENPHFPGRRHIVFSQPRFSEVIKFKGFGSSLAAEILQSGEPLAVLDDRVEFGPRALGATSILFHSTDPHCFEVFNEKVKKREAFRPLAPICLAEDADAWFVIPENARHLTETMSTLVKPAAQTLLKYPGYIHVDGTCRLQTVKRDGSLIVDILTACAGLDCDVLVNTSFNVAGDPMVYDEVDAILSLRRMGLRFVATRDGIYEVP